MRFLFVGLVALTACTSSVQTVEPVMAPPVKIDTVVVTRDSLVFLPSYCDTAFILQKYCRGEASGVEDGVKWRVAFETTVKKLAEATQTISVLKKQVSVSVDRPPVEVPAGRELTAEIQRLRQDLAVSKSKEYGFWVRLRDYLAFALGGCLVGWILSKMKIPI